MEDWECGIYQVIREPEGWLKAIPVPGMYRVIKAVVDPVGEVVVLLVVSASTVKLQQQRKKV